MNIPPRLHEFLAEFDAVLELSPKIQIYVSLATWIPAAILLCGDYATSSITLSAPLTPLTAPIREAVFDEDIAVAILTCLTFFTAAIKQYHRARERLLCGV